MFANPNDFLFAMDDVKKEVVSAQLAQQAVLQESAAEGGPTSVNSAIVNLMETYDVGYRYLAKEVNIPRKKLVKMIEGLIDMPADVLSRIYNVFDKINPDLFGEYKK